MVQVIFGAKSRFSTRIESFTKEVSPKINELQAITFYDRRAHNAQTCPAPPKRHFLEKKIGPNLLLKKIFPQKKFGVEKWKLANRLKRVFPKFRADRSHVRGVNGRVKFRTNFEIRELAFEKVTQHKNCAFWAQFLCYATVFMYQDFGKAWMVRNPIRSL